MGNRGNAGAPVMACRRCRSHKIKCDRRLPKCHSCERVGAACLTVDPASGRVLPRSYILNLEARIQNLEQQLSGKTPDLSPMVSENSATFLGPSSGIAFAGTLASTLHEQLAAESRQLPTTPKQRDQEISKSPMLPTKQAAERALKPYFELINPQYPVLHREEFLHKYFTPVYGAISSGLSLANEFTRLNVPRDDGDPPTGSLYRQFKDTGIFAEPTVNSRKALYFVYQVCAIATAGDQANFAANVAESLHLTAMQYYNTVLTSPNRLEVLQAVLLFAVYSLMRPAQPGIWFVVGTAMRMCIEMGLHSESTAALYKTSGATEDPLILDMQRRLFWCTYTLECQICLYLGRPISLSQEYIGTKFPSPVDDSWLMPDKKLENAPSRPSYKWIALGGFNLRILQSQIQRVVYDGLPWPPNLGFGTLDEWVDHMKSQLDSWYKAMPKDIEITNCKYDLRFTIINYLHTRLLLFGISPVSTGKVLNKNLDSVYRDSLDILKLYHQIFRDQKLNFSWVTVHNVYQAAICYLYVVFHCAPLHNLTTLGELEVVMVSTQEVFDALKVYCDAARKCHATLNKLASRVAAMLRSTATENVTEAVVPSLAFERAEPANGVERKADEMENKEFESLSIPFQSDAMQLPPNLNAVGAVSTVSDKEISSDLAQNDPQWTELLSFAVNETAHTGNFWLV